MAVWEGAQHSQIVTLSMPMTRFRWGRKAQVVPMKAHDSVQHFSFYYCYY
jgi:hypothetical protein